MGRGAIRLFLIMLLVVAIAWTMYSWGRNEYRRPGPLGSTTIIVLKRGVSVERAARILRRDRVIGSPTVFVFAARFTDADRKIRAGEYAFEPRISVAGVLAKLTRGETLVRKVTIPEGLTSLQVRDLIQSTEALSGAVPERIGEGLLLPETYHYSRDDTRAGLVARMRDAMTRTLMDLWAGRDSGLPLGTPQEALILASIVEKETSRADERAHIAGVFVNRLRRGMRLQSDPTVAYGLSGGRPLGRDLTKADLADLNLYNTYQHTGLPPSPIANPGRASVEAVMHPMRTGDLYFVADGSGGHAFASTLEAHNRNVRRWRALQKSTD